MTSALPYGYVLALVAIAFVCGYVFRWSCERDRAALAYRPPCACEELRALADVYIRAQRPTGGTFGMEDTRYDLF